MKDHGIKPSTEHHTLVIIRLENAKRKKDRKVIGITTESFRSIYNAERRAHELRDSMMLRTESMPYLIATEIIERKAA